MWHLLHLIARPFEVLLGGFCVLSAIVLYPGEEGKIQSKFEDFWIRVDDFKDLALTRHAAFMTGVAKLETRFLDRIFGKKLFSARAIGASIICTLTSLALVFLFTSAGSRDYSDSMRAGFDIAALLMLLCVGIFTLSIRFRARVRALLLVLALLFLGWLLRDMSNAGETPQNAVQITIMVGTAVLSGFIGDVAFIACTRRILRWAGQMQSSLKVIVAVVSSFLLAVILISPPVLAGTFFYHPGENKAGLGETTMGLLSIAALANFFDAILASLFVFLAIILLIHRAIWPLLVRTLFRLQESGTKGRRAILATIGFSLLGTSVFGGEFPKLWEKILEKFGG